MSYVAAAVHTTGINWEGVAAVSASVCTIVSIALFPAVRSFKRTFNASLRETIETVIDAKVTPELQTIKGDIAELKAMDSKLDRRVSKLEGIEEGKRTILDQQKHSRPSAG